MTTNTSAFCQKANNLSDVASVSTAVTNLGAVTTNTANALVVRDSNGGFSAAYLSDNSGVEAFNPVTRAAYTSSAGVPSAFFDQHQLRATGGSVVAVDWSSVNGINALIGTNSTVQDTTDATKQMQWGLSSATTGTKTTVAFAQTANRTLTMPDATDTLVGRATTDTLTNKTLTSPVISTIVNTGTLTLPTSTDTIVGRATTDTLTNKTINGSNNTITNVSLATGVTGNLPVTNLNSGTSASSSTFWRGDGTWAAPSGSTVYYPNRATIHPFERQIVAGNAFTVTISAGYIGGAAIFQNTSSSSDITSTTVELGSGTYTFWMYFTSYNAGGIMTLEVDGTNVGTIDTYSGSSNAQAYGTITSISIATNGVHLVRFKMLTKNASSSAYSFQPAIMGFYIVPDAANHS